MASTGKDSNLASTLLVIEQLPKLVEEQVKAISNLKIDKVTVWDNGKDGKDGKGSTADFLSGLVGAVPPLHDITKNVGIELPAFLGKIQEDVKKAPTQATKPTSPPKKPQGKQEPPKQ